MVELLVVIILILLLLLIKTSHELSALRREFSLRLKLAQEEWIQAHERRIKEETLQRSRSTLKGRIAEQLVPFFEEFKYNPADARFIGSPIDYIIFDGMSDERKDLRVVLADIKTGNSKLNATQMKIKDAVERGRVMWETIELKK